MAKDWKQKILKTMNIKRVFHDPIHKEIVFDSGKPEELMVLELIDTVAFQRLRRIKQLGAASLLFHGVKLSNKIIFSPASSIELI